MNGKQEFLKTTQKDCFSRCRFIYEFNVKADEEFVNFLENFGEVIVFRNFDIPLIKMDVKDRFRLTMLFNSGSMSVFFKEKCPKSFMLKFDKELNKFLLRKK